MHSTTPEGKYQAYYLSPSKSSLSQGYDCCREYDEDGNLRDWWNNATLSKFKNLTECFVDQYSKYEILKTGGWKKLDKKGDKVGANVEAVVSVRGKNLYCLVVLCIIVSCHRYLGQANAGGKYCRQWRFKGSLSRL